MSMSAPSGASQHPAAADTRAEDAPASARANPWILNGWQDLLFFVATPLLIIPLVAILQGYLTVADISLYVLSLGSLGHHLPGMIRAYGDRELFARYRVRFILAPLFLLAVCGFFAHRNLNGLSVMVLLWGTWHGAAQVYGFLRIYDAKAGSFSPVTAKLDMAMCIAWFGLGVIQSPDRIGSILRAFYSSGGPLIPGSTIHALQSAWTVTAAAVTAAFLANCVWQWRQGRPPSAAKLLLLISSFGFWWYTNIGVGNIILGVAMFEIFHDVQYLAIVWVYNVKRVQTGHRVGAFTRFLFRRSWFLVGLYVGLVFAYGYINLFAGMVDTQNVKLTLFGLVSASTFLHYYYDGFIWKVREKSTREGLGMSGGQSELSVQSLVPSWLRHGLYWSLFVVPVALLASAELRGALPKLERELAIVDAFPNSAMAHYKAGAALLRQQRFEEAMVHYQKALRIMPDHAEAHNNLGVVLQGLGRSDESIAHYQEALRIKPDHAVAHNNLGNALQGMGRLDEAVARYQTALRLKPDYTDAHNNCGDALLALGRSEEAVAHFREALRIDPDYALAHTNLGLALQNLGRFEEAVAHYQEVLRIKPDSDDAHTNLGLVLENLGRFEEAVAHYQETLRIKPDNAEVHNNFGILLAKQGRLQDAIEHFQQAVHLKPDLADAQKNLHKAEAMLQQTHGPAQP